MGYDPGAVAVAPRWLAWGVVAAIGACADANDPASSAGGDGSTSSDAGATTSSGSGAATSEAGDASGDSDGGDASSSTTGDGPPGPCDPAASVEPWDGTWQPPHALHRGVCTPQDASAIASCFIDAQSCDVAVSAACHDCALSSPQSGESAPLQTDEQGVPVGLNIAGCVAQLDGDPSEAGCGPKVEAYLDCVDQACAACTDPDLLPGCRDDADATTCSAAAAAADCAIPYLSQCTGDTLLDTAFDLIAIFCGP